ncbi:U-box domain-containing protein 6-like [Pyrus ussuriensis x Pyrus communis]|uniref:U-box domain-containing protein 6-like n=1 Tax=Pyrus ussuriensis x Pyrus communis TaxID=2448454 RepID=A0A5N5G443_9ROSA|nr:U-box domain-containing protein 6-like [Pyrus ussuriensis x Pyrus communis]
MEELVLHNLFSGDRAAQIEAATELGKLKSKQRHKLAERGVMVPLISMLHSEDAEAIEASLFSLLSLAFGSERNKSRIVKSGALPALLNLLRCESKAVIELTIAAFLILSSCKGNKLPIASAGAIQLIVELLNQDYAEGISLQARLDGIATLHNLSTCHQIIPSLVSSGIVFSLQQIFHGLEKSNQLVEKAIALLDDIVSSSETALEETAATCGAIQALVETIEEGSTKSKEHAARILLLICQSCREKYRGLILREGAMPGLLQMSVDGSWTAKTTARELLFLLRDCSNYGSRNKQSRNKVIEQIMEEIDAEGERVAGTSTSAQRLVEEMLSKISIGR